MIEMEEEEETRSVLTEEEREEKEEQVPGLEDEERTMLPEAVDHALQLNTITWTPSILLGSQSYLLTLPQTQMQSE